MQSSNNGRLELTPEEMRRLGYAVVDTIVDYVQNASTNPVVKSVDGTEPLTDVFHKPVPRNASDPLDVLKTVKEEIFSDMIHVSAPQFYGYVPGPGNFVGAMADALSSGLNIFAGTSTHSHGPAQIEASMVSWLCNLAGLPEGAGGTFVSGGSVANLTGLILARHRMLGQDISKGVLYCSSETHSCIDRAAKVLGFSPEQLVRISTDAELRMKPDVLAARISADRASGKKPFMILGTMGTTSTGTVDPLNELADIAEREDLWFHVDAAYGGGALLSERKRQMLSGVERADSIAMDQHKWFFQPIECGTILVRDMKWLREFFYILPGYMKDSVEVEGTINYRDYGIQLTRGLRALKLWMSLHTFGEDAFRRAVEHGLGMAEYAEQRLRENRCWQIIVPANLGIVAFRYQVDGLDQERLNSLNNDLNRQLVASKKAFMSTTELNGIKCLRLCTINPRCTQQNISEVIDELEAIGPRLVADL